MGGGGKHEKKKNFFVFARTRARALTPAKNSSLKPLKAVKSRMHARCGERYTQEAHRGHHRPRRRFARYFGCLMAEAFTGTLQPCYGLHSRQSKAQAHAETVSYSLRRSSCFIHHGNACQRRTGASIGRSGVFPMLCSSDGGGVYRGFKDLL